GCRVAQSLGNALDGTGDVALGRRLRIKILELLQGLGRERRSGRGPEIFRRKILPADSAQIVIHVAGADIVRVTVASDILKQLLARQVQAGADDSCQSWILQVDFVFLATFAAELELDFGAAHAHVTVPHGGQTEGAV